jgi:predicted phosphoribosyltransferase
MVVSADSSSVQYFIDRRDAGRRLAQSIAQRDIKDHLLILGLPRGGVPVAYEVARELNAPLDVWLVRKLGVPGHEELAMGALAPLGLSSQLQTEGSSPNTH